MNARSGRRPGPLYAIADAGRIPPARLAGAVAEMAGAGVVTIQLRAKSLPGRELWRLAEQVLARLEGWSGELWIDDRADLAAALPFSGVHLGQRDLPPALARPLLPEPVAIGFSTHDERQAAGAESDPAVDWVAIGPVFPTVSKENPDPALGLEGLAAARARTAKPLIAIGGIDERTIAAVLDAGAEAAAVISAVCDGDVAANCRRLLAAARSSR
ncbi:MAG: thiamine phosphate synthase [Thermoanaerobaculia bacterium]|nr:MAG: thiamine phosphate synthase [Thermoanaerobaculia bacterium]